MKPHSLLCHLSMMRSSSVVEGGMASDMKFHTPLRHADPANQLMVPWRVRRQTDGHKIQDLTDAGRRMEARHKHVGIRPVELFLRDVCVGRSDLEPAALLIVENGRKHAGRVEMRNTQPIDRSVQTDERRRAHIADEAVILNGLVTHRLRLTESSEFVRTRIKDPTLHRSRRSFCHIADIRIQHAWCPALLEVIDQRLERLKLTMV